MKKLLFVCAISLLATTTAASAKPDHKYGKYKDSQLEATLEIAISIADRNVIHDYMRRHYNPKKCPPGLAKKRNGCLPPGIAKKYAMGQALPPGIKKKGVPNDLLSQLTPIAGYQYIQVDKDVLLISEATKHVVDAVTLLSAVD